ncbi:Maf family protein [Parvularcula maris]|uniref:Nucleoside triphosphate pyrophosphatase n=1 Tax=Parvularcula maris TaxID=2965077 RepID=A0A9X2L6F2_9PROT|nr:nucleoside triphosphate pyrophosphatase [Parvularcula maris]MCQ8183823.1 Maf family protein [Parvularcula maris]
MTKLILASGSASRRSILKGAGVAFEVVRPDTDEAALKAANPGLDPAELALMLAEAKCLDVAKQASGDAVVVGSDQVLEFEGRAYDKPESREELRDRLMAMAGKPHFLRGGMVAARGGEVIERSSSSAELTMRHFTQQELDLYLSEAPDWIYGTVGGYGLESSGVRLFDRIEGDYFSILGLDLLSLLPVLRREGVLAW